MTLMFSRLLTIIAVLCFSCKLHAHNINIATVEKYLNGIGSLVANFKQWDKSGNLTKGKLYIKKPGLLCMQYSGSEQIVILSDNKNIFFIDKGTNDIATMPIANTPAKIFLYDDLNIAEQFVLKQFSHKQNTITVTLGLKNQDVGYIELLFAEHPMRLIQWQITDVHNNNTLVQLYDMQTNVPINDSIFSLGNIR